MKGKCVKIMIMENKNIKLAIFDIDDTLIKRGKVKIESSAVQAINDLKSKGIEVMIATGRAFYFIHDDIHETINPDYYVTINGACVYDHLKEVIFDVPMVRSEVNAMIEYCNAHDIGLAMKMRHDMRVYRNMEIFKTVYMQGSDKQDILVDYTHAQTIEEGDEVPMGLFLMGDEALIEASKPLCPDGHYAKAYADAYDIYSNRAGKIAGIGIVLDRLGLTWDEVIAFGDAANDLTMLEKAAIGVAMGNAPDHVKEAADYVTTDILEDGIFNAIQTIF
ncbi:Cof-type HAD-IIB family hydrolase [Erysipelothrix tonsillarum]|uniref:Cof-type HAD-IIB family hydrolase n=2 Tax=Erysipelothrix tonsillarum TaxID=38402 RepID=UPI000361A15C